MEVTRSRRRILISAAVPVICRICMVKMARQRRSQKSVKHPLVGQHWFQVPLFLDMRAEFSLHVSASIKDFTFV